MKFWLKIESFINKILIVISNFLSRIVLKLTPKSVKKTVAQTDIIRKKTTINFKESISKSKQFTLKSIGDVKKKSEKAKISALEKVVKAKSYDYKSITPKKVLAGVSLLFAPLFIKTQKWLSGLKPTTIVVGTAGMMAITLTGITVIKQASEIDNKMAKEVVREPSSYSDTMDSEKLAHSRSKFRHYTEMSLQLNDVNIPIYIEERKGMQTLLVDFSFRASNRYIAKYFEKIQNEYVLRDRIYKNVQPIIPSFPMEEEGKIILRNKIKRELNNVLKDLKIDGTIEEVYIQSILNG
ncbi:hypothetical protein [Bacteriovorax sp. Seq25_V]|uniref:hypothetical protein n=1 Tax=Bacteriovorax sp. Seq25_V TaxID=1201288 RepID=UPI00038A2C1F|nr:hypothetical protein [Bacteriovorax sp. Seq25_V]EQC47516.1 hypothetical protein M900_0616 [Bacteriovorax sp. Seq25_V]